MQWPNAQHTKKKKTKKNWRGKCARKLELQKFMAWTVSMGRSAPTKCSRAAFEHFTSLWASVGVAGALGIAVGVAANSTWETAREFVANFLGIEMMASLGARSSAPGSLIFRRRLSRSAFFTYLPIRRPFCGFIIIYSYASGCRNGKIVNRRIYSNDWVQNLKQSNISDLPAKLLNWKVIIIPNLSLNYLTNVKLHYLFFIFLCNESISNALLWVLSIYLSPVRG